MRQIRKLPPPESHIRYLATPDPNYRDYPANDKQSLREQLVREQRGLCCYCLCRIQSAAGHVKIEHWRSQKNHPEDALDYGNMLAACMGGEEPQDEEERKQSRSPRILHCDSSKGAADLKWSPADRDRNVEDRIRYGADGTIMSDDTDFDAQLSAILNLNDDLLRRKRKDVLDAFLKEIPRGGNPSRAKLQNWLNAWNGDGNAGDLREYCQIVVYWLRKRLARA
jgi:uncharacterized protein (TIGR02646 family)